jgi:hypothetical protein
MLLIASQNTVTATEQVYQHLQSGGSSRAEITRRSSARVLPTQTGGALPDQLSGSAPRVTYCDYCLAAVT